MQCNDIFTMLFPFCLESIINTYMIMKQKHPFEKSFLSFCLTYWKHINLTILFLFYSES